MWRRSFSPAPSPHQVTLLPIKAFFGNQTQVILWRTIAALSGASSQHRGSARLRLERNRFIWFIDTWRKLAANRRFPNTERHSGCTGGVWLTSTPQPEPRQAPPAAGFSGKSGNVPHMEGIIHDYSSINRGRGWKRICALAPSWLPLSPPVFLPVLTFVPIITAVAQPRAIPVSSGPQMCRFPNTDGVKTSKFLLFSFFLFVDIRVRNMSSLKDIKAHV